MKRMSKRMLSAVMAIVLGCSMAGVPDMKVTADTVEDTESLSLIQGEESYEEYLLEYEDVAAGKQSIQIGNGELVHKGNGVNVQEEASTGESFLFGKKDAYVEYSVSMEVEGMYYMTLQYAQTANTNRTMEVGLQINGSYPFTEAMDIDIPRIYEDVSEIRVDRAGNEVSPQQIPVLSEQEWTLRNTSGWYEGCYAFYLKEGENTIRIDGNGMEFALMGVALEPAEDVVTYEEYLAQTNGADSSDVFLKLQAESAQYKSDSVLYPNYDRVNLATEDANGNYNNPSNIAINTIGGNLWNTTGQWMSWEFEVPEDGYYNLGCRFRQNYLDGLFTSRAVYIDDVILFDDLSRVEFMYDDEWQVMDFCDETGEALKVYLTAGTHEVKMMCTMGEFADTLRRINDCIYRVNDLYRQIIMITSTSPDTYTDYFLEQRIPGLKDTLQDCSNILSVEIDNVVEMVGGHGSQTATLETLRVQLDSFIEDTDEIPIRLSNFKDNISAMGSWLVNIRSQGLQLDYLYVKSPNMGTPKSDANVMQKAWYSVRRFFASFDDSSLSVGGDAEQEQKITVWLSSAANAAQTSVGRDQAQILKELIDESFTPDTGIEVDLQLVQGSLIEATLAGQGPDVALMIAEDQPVNFAIRGALQDLTEFEDYKEVLGNFYESSVVPFWYEKGLYALPDTQVYNMLFYRTDVFEELGIEAPKTWDEFYSVLPVIQRNNLQITIQDVFPALLLQNGGSYYNEAGTKSMLDSQVAIDAMTTYTDLYVKYGFEVKTDFYSRFRSGELVMSIQPYNMYNQLMVAAPEINGLWEMVPIPGVVSEDGSMNNSQNATVTGTVMLDSCKNKEAAWEFMKWWSSDEIKAKYAIALEGMLGASARFTPANKGTLTLLPWSDEELQQLTEAWENVIGIPQLPGSYYTSRGLTNAFRSIVYNEDFPRYAMRVQTKYINEEIMRKRSEFGLNTTQE